MNNYEMRWLDIPKGYDFSKFRVMNDTVISQPIQVTEVAGLLIPTQNQEQVTKGKVLAVGPGRLISRGKTRKQDIRTPMKVKVGDIIYHSQYAGSETEIAHTKHIIMPEMDVWGIFTGNRPIDIKPFDDKILLEWQLARSEFLGTDLARPQNYIERNYTGVVMAKGPEVYDVKIGERVFFNQFCGPERIDYTDKHYAFITENDIRSVIPAREEVTVLSE
jgi:chaperonin GroES